MTNRVSTLQFWLLAVVLSFTFKVNSLVGIMSKTFDTSTAVAFGLYLLTEVIVTFLVYKICKKGAIYNLKPMLKGVISIALALVLVLKALLYFSEQASFIGEFLANDMAEWLKLIVVIIPALLLAKIGFNGLARTNEIISVIVALGLIFAVILFRTEIHFEYNMPIFEKSYDNPLGYFAWFGDSVALIFCKIEDNKQSRARLAVGVSAYICGLIFCIILAVISVGVYGGALKDVSSIFVKLSVFNEYAFDFGRLDWIGITSWLTCSFVVTSAISASLNESVKITLKTDKNYGLILFIGIYFAVLNGLANYQNAVDLSVQYFGYIVIFTITICLVLTYFLGICGEKDEKYIKK